MAPARILLLRHAEEPGNATNPDLSAEGRLRADRLSIYLPMIYGRPDFVIAAAPNKLSVRAYLTLRPLSLATSASVDTSFKANRYVALATQLLAEAKYANKLVIICWTHTRLPALAAALAARAGKYPDPWKESVFNLILQLDYKQGGKPTVTQVRQPF